MVVGGGESDYSVCPRPLLQFLQFFQFMSGYIRLRQVTSVYVGGTGRGARQYLLERLEVLDFNFALDNNEN